MLRRKSVILALLAFAAVVANATEIRLSYGVLERLLAQQVFTDDGRKYVRGNKATKCNFAYLEHPNIWGKDGRLSIKARFTGRAAWDLLGRCVGTGDAFDVTVNGVPYYDHGNVAFKDVTIDSDRDGFYIRHVKSALRDTLSREFKYNIMTDAKRLMEQQDPGQPYSRKLIRFDVASIQVAPDSLVLNVDFVLSVQ